MADIVFGKQARYFNALYRGWQRRNKNFIDDSLIYVIECMRYKVLDY
jgi:hypothetical protein